MEEAFQCLECAPGCESCTDASPCIVTLNWVLRTILLILQCIIICCLPIVVLFTYKYKDIKVRTVFWYVRMGQPMDIKINRLLIDPAFVYACNISYVVIRSKKANLLCVKNGAACEAI